MQLTITLKTKKKNMNADNFILKQRCKAIFSLYYSKYKEYLIDIEGILSFNDKNLVIPDMFLMLNNNNFKGIFFKFKQENEDFKDKSYFLVDYLIQSGYKYVEISNIYTFQHEVKKYLIIYDYFNNIIQKI